MACNFNNTDAIVGANYIKLYENIDINFVYPNIANLTEINEITNSGYIFESDLNSNVKWSRKTDFSGNYKQIFSDLFSFNLTGLNSENRAILDKLRAVRTGFIVELYLTDGTVLIFPTPVFVSKPYEKKIDSKTFELELNYRVPTFDDYLINISSQEVSLYPFYQGVVDEASDIFNGITYAEILALGGMVEGDNFKGNKTVKTSPTNERYCIMYPSSYGALTSIIDNNGFETLPAYNTFSYTVIGSTGLSSLYRVYILNGDTTTVDFTNTYKF